MILVPVKNLVESKRRLSLLLTAEERQALARAMLQDVLSALAHCSRRSQVALVTGDSEAIRLAGQFSFQIIEDRDNGGESEAIAMATAVCEQRGEAETLVLPADIPLVASSEIEAVFAAAPAAGTVIVPSREERGSNAVLRRPCSLFPLKFGDDSFQPHLRAAEATGLPCAVARLRGIELDVDRPADLAELALRPGNTRAQQLAREWNVLSRLHTPAVPA
ncbi:MAG: 2-phospho-L-lactate guanylyltransferase [Acidobacteriales bacterium]|nr:2-phospho-L-lactate guanylyltransferase [Terriglobales bacterium]